MSQDNKPAFSPDHEMAVPVAPQIDPVKKFAGMKVERPVRYRAMDDERKYTGSGRNLEKFLPEGRTEIPLFATDVKFGEKKEVLFVDTLAMQTKLGVTKRLSEQSMSMRDSEIVRPRNLTSSAFAQGGTIKVAGVQPPSVLDLAGSTILRESKVKMTQQAPQHPGGVQMMPSPRKIAPSSDAVQVQAPPTVMGISAAEQAPLEGMAKKIQERLEGLREEMQEKFEQRKQQFPMPQLPQVVLVETASAAAAVAPVSAPKREDIVLEPAPVVDQSGRVKELETENEVLVAIVARLSAENKALKARK